MRVDEMEAGRELDALVAEKVMGWRLVPDPHYHGLGGAMFAVMESGERCFMWHLREHVYSGERQWSPSADIVAAWRVVEYLRANGWPVIRIGIGDILGDNWQCQVADCWREVSYEGDKDVFANAPTVTLAICRAALLAVGVEVSP